MEPTTTHHKILVIDDEENYRQIIAMTLQMMGYGIIEATNGLDGLAAVKMHHPDLILCDINMPKMDGHELLETLKNEQEFAGIPFIFLTGNSASGDVRKGMQLGADDYLTKPFTAEELVNAVGVRLVKKRSIERYFESQFDDIRSNIVLSLPHEFRTPLNGILGFSQILMDEEAISASEVKEIGTMIHRSGKRLHHLLENMALFGQLQLWRHDTAKLTELQSASSGPVEDTLRGAAESEMDKHDRPNAVRFGPCSGSTHMSAQFLEKVAEELIDNALKFSEKGTEVHLQCQRRGPSLHLIVKDSGRGMTEEQMAKISGFQQFERGYYEQQGAGLGLTLVRLLTEVHGGTVTVESVKDTSTTVTVMLPAEI